MKQVRLTTENDKLLEGFIRDLNSPLTSESHVVNAAFERGIKELRKNFVRTRKKVNQP